MFSKNLFKNEDGTLKPIRITLFVCFIVALIMAFFLKDTNVFKPNLNRITTTNPISTTTIAICKDCSFEFNKKTIDVEPGTEVPLDDIMEYKNIDLNQISFTSEDTQIARIVSHKGKLYIKAEEIVGTTKIKGELDNKKTEIEVIVKATKIKEAHLSDKLYFVYVNKNNIIDVETIPKGADHKLLKLSTDNPDIAEFNEKGELVGKMVGEVKIYLETTRELTEEEKKLETTGTIVDRNVKEERICYVVNNKITVKVKEGSTFKETNEYKYRGTYSGDISIALSIEDNLGENLTGDDIKWEIIPQGSMNGTISYEGKAANNVDYLYKVGVSFNEEEAMEENKITVYFTLPDGSKTRLVIIKQ